MDKHSELLDLFDRLSPDGQKMILSMCNYFVAEEEIKNLEMSFLMPDAKNAALDRRSHLTIVK